jgi:hypothetical protein
MRFESIDSKVATEILNQGNLQMEATHLIHSAEVP